MTNPNSEIERLKDELEVERAVNRTLTERLSAIVRTARGIGDLDPPVGGLHQERAAGIREGADIALGMLRNGRTLTSEIEAEVQARLNRP